ncbi:PIN domain-containing protein [Reichenbachiella sp. MALMAid0571]|uniref:PIN domain-containing protein n=1 Tax=Reichenbachiella sp. MALMAid0571 TaxID=3143939 RepID=UPI0032DF9DB0
MEKNQLVLCDTNILIEFYRENPEILKSLKLIGQENIAISIVSSAELIYGAINKRELNQIKKDISHLIEIDIDKGICEVFIELIKVFFKSQPYIAGWINCSYSSSSTFAIIYFKQEGFQIHR